MKAPYDVNLTQLDDGSIIVRVGCKLLSYRPRDFPVGSFWDLFADLKAYFDDPEGTIKRFSAGFGWPLGTLVGQTAQPPDPYRPFRDAADPFERVRDDIQRTPSVGGSVGGGSEVTPR